MSLHTTMLYCQTKEQRHCRTKICRNWLYYLHKILLDTREGMSCLFQVHKRMFRLDTLPHSPMLYYQRILVLNTHMCILR